MASTDIDGSILVILSYEEAYTIYDMLWCVRNILSPVQRGLARKIERDLNLPPLETWHEAVNS